MIGMYWKQTKLMMFISRTNKSNHAPAPEVRGQKEREYYD
nr:MAG TPA: hypothetical protein [Caudoviricetes sp.]